MAFWKRNRAEAPATENQNNKDQLLAGLDTLKNKRMILMSYIGTDAWVTAYREKLEKLEEEIAELEKRLELDVSDP